MYQMATIFKSYEKYIPTFGSLGTSRIVPSIGSKLIRPKKEDVERADSILNNIYRIISKNVEKLGYLYEDKPYSGSVVLVGNEGNIRMDTVMPQTHIAMTGIDKIVPTMRYAMDEAIVQAAYAGIFPPT